MSEQAWAHVLWQSEGACLKGWGARAGVDARARMAVYRNNVWSSLTQALADTYPVLRQVMGEALFAYAAQTYVQGAPPDDAVLAHYGAGFADCLQALGCPAHAPHTALAWPDVARLEYARVQSFHAADAQALSVTRWQRLLAQPACLQDAVFTCLPCVQVVVSAWPVCSWWSAWQTGEVPVLSNDTPPETALVCREGWDVMVVPLSAVAGDFVARLQRGVPFGLAAQMALHEDVSFNLTHALALLMRHGCIEQVRALPTPQ